MLKVLEERTGPHPLAGESPEKDREVLEIDSMTQTESRAEVQDRAERETERGTEARYLTKRETGLQGPARRRHQLHWSETLRGRDL